MVELGKYGPTVLGAWGVTLLLLAGLVAQSLWRNAAARRALQAEEGSRRG